jgi:hypothetical protein
MDKSAAVKIHKMKTKTILLWLLSSVLLLYHCSNCVFAAPTFITPTNNQVFNLVEDTEFTYMVTVSDLSANLPINFTDDSGDSQIGFYCFRKYYHNSTAWLVNFTPENENVGYYSIHIIANNNVSEASVVIVNFNVSNANDPPSIASTSPENASHVSEDSSLPLFADALDPDLQYGDNLSFSWYLDGVLADPKLTNTKFNSTRSNATYFPDYWDYGVHNITVAVRDKDNASANYTWTINVNNTNRPPIFNRTINNLTWPEDTNITDNFTLTDHFYDPDTNGTQCEIDTLSCLEYDFNITEGDPDGIDITIDQASGNVSFSPAEHWYGWVSVVFSASDSYNMTYSNTVLLNVTHINVPPEISPVPNQTAYANTIFSYLVEATDAEDDPLVYSISSTTLSAIDIDGSGLIQMDLNSSHVGNHTVNVTVSDGANSSSTLFNLEILSHNRPYIIPFTNLSVIQHSAYTVIVNASTDYAGDLSFSSNWSAINPGSGFNSTAWDFTFTIDSQYMVGTNAVRIYVSDSVNSTNFYDFNMEVIDDDMPPEIDPESVPNSQIKINTLFTKNAYAFDEEGEIVEFSDNTSLFNISTIFLGDMSSDAIALISFTPDATGYNVINISVNDSSGQVDWTLFMLNVTLNHDPYFTHLENITCNESIQCDYDVDADDFDWQDTLLYGSNSTDFTIDPDSGEISYVPSSIGYFPVTVWVSDGTANISSQIVLNISETNHPPHYVQNISTLSVWSNVREDMATAFSVMAVDDENDSLSLNISFASFTNLANVTVTDGIGLFNFTGFIVHANNSVTASVNFTPNSTQPGTYTVSFMVSDNRSTTSQVFSFFVHHAQVPPEVNWSLSYPFGALYLNGSEADTPNQLDTTENTTIFINATAYSLYYEPIHFEWYANSSGSLIEIGNQSIMNYTIPFYGHPDLALILHAICEDGATSAIYWSMNVTNVNRPPVFGTYEYLFNVSDGIFNHTEIEDRNLVVEKESLTEYYNSSSFVSGSMDFKTTSLDLPRIGYDNMTLLYSSSDDYAVGLQTATSNLLFNGNWAASENGSVNSSDYRYLWFRLNITLFNNSVTPQIGEAVVRYSLKDLSVTKDTEYAAWIDLDHFFRDADTDDTLNYTSTIMSGGSLINVSIVQDHYVALRFLDTGSVILVFNATDQSGASAHSNQVNIEITSESSNSDSSSSSSSSTRTVTVTNTNTQYIYQEQPQPVYLDIIYPLNITIYQDETITVPLLLQNSGDIDLSGLRISAYSDRPGLSMRLDTTELSGLPSRSEKTVNLFMNMTEVYDSYTVYIAVNVTDPKYDTTAKMIISSLKKNQEKNDSETLKLAFVSDLLQRNEECAELTEYVTRAREYLNNDDSKSAAELLDKFINDCKILIKANQEREEKPSTITGNLITIIKGNTDYLIITGAIAALVLITSVIALVHAYRKI